MKNKLFIIATIIILGETFNNTFAQELKKDSSHDSLFIVWTSGDPDVALKMVFMYATTSKLKHWWSDVQIIIWGPSAKLTAENSQIQAEIEKMIKLGIEFEAAKACTDQYGVSEKLSSLGVNVKLMGPPFTEILKSDKKLITF